MRYFVFNITILTFGIILMIFQIIKMVFCVWGHIRWTVSLQRLTILCINGFQGVEQLLCWNKIPAIFPKTFSIAEYLPPVFVNQDGPGGQ